MNWLPTPWTVLIQVEDVAFLIGATQDNTIRAGALPRPFPNLQPK